MKNASSLPYMAQGRMLSIFSKKLFADNLTDDSDHRMCVGDWNVTFNQLFDTSGYLHKNNVKQSVLVDPSSFVDFTYSYDS